MSSYGGYSEDHYDKVIRIQELETALEDMTRERDAALRALQGMEDDDSETLFGVYPNAMADDYKELKARLDGAARVTFLPTDEHARYCKAAISPWGINIDQMFNYVPGLEPGESRAFLLVEDK